MQGHLRIAEHLTQAPPLERFSKRRLEPDRPEGGSEYREI